MTSYRSTLFASRHFPHHSRYSGYEQIARRWPGPKEVVELPSRTGLTSAHGIVRAFAHKRYNFALWRTKRHLRRLARTNRFQILHVLYGDTDLPIHELPPKCRLIATLHQPVSHLSRSRRRIDQLRHQLKRVDLCIVVSREQADLIRTVSPQTCVHFVPHGVDVDFFTPGRRRKAHTILSVGSWYRDPKRTVDILKVLLRHYPQCRVRLVGMADLELANEMAKRINRLPRLSDEQLRREYASCTLLFLPLQEATANNALLEAMACGGPVVAPRIGGVLDYIPNQETLYEPDASPREIALHIRKVAETSTGSDVASIWRGKAETYSWQNVMRFMNDLYHQL